MSSCNLPEFADFQEPNSFHRYICSICNVSKPNARLLDIHVQEVHDSFFKILAERQPMVISKIFSLLFIITKESILIILYFSV